MIKNILGMGVLKHNAYYLICLIQSGDLLTVIIAVIITVIIKQAFEKRNMIIQ